MLEQSLFVFSKGHIGQFEFLFFQIQTKLDCISFPVFLFLLAGQNQEYGNSTVIFTTEPDVLVFANSIFILSPRDRVYNV